MLAHSPAAGTHASTQKGVGLQFDHAIAAPWSCQRTCRHTKKRMALAAIDHSSSNSSMSACIFSNHGLFLSDTVLRSTFMISTPVIMIARVTSLTLVLALAA